MDRRAVSRRSVLPARPRDASDAGFSLVEVMTALVVFALVSAGALTLVLRAAETIRGNQDRVLAAAIAASELDRVREVGTSSIELGRTTRTEVTESGDFEVTTDATWVTLGLQVDPCDVGDGVDLEQSYLRVHVEVAGGDIDVPQTSDTLLYPEDVARDDGVGTMTVQVSDSAGAPLAGVAVSGSDGAGNSFSQSTGVEGCIFVPDLLAGNNWQVAITKSGFRTEEPGAEIVSGVAVNALANTDLAFTIDQPGSFTVTAGSADYPLPDGTAFTYQRESTVTVAPPETTFPAVVDDLWPDQYTAWLGTCPVAVTASAANIVVAPAASATKALPTGQVDFVAEAGSVITISSQEVGCDTQVVLPEVGEEFLVRTSLPYGDWLASVAPVEEPGDQTFFLGPGASPCSVSWTVPSVSAPEPTPSPTTTASPDPSATATPEPSPTATLPEVSEPCPASEPTP